MCRPNVVSSPDYLSNDGQDLVTAFLPPMFIHLHCISLPSNMSNLVNNVVDFGDGCAPSYRVLTGAL